jgi:Bacterial PH domain
VIESVPQGRAPLSRRISPVQTALLILLACGCAALNIYAHPSGPARAVSIPIGVTALGLAAAGMRMFLFVDADGVELRHLLRFHSLSWSQISRVEIVSGVRGSDTIRFFRSDGSYVDVPPSLLQPSKPTTRPNARRALEDTLRQVNAHRPRSA